MRFLHLKVEDFDMMLNPANCDIITLGPKQLVEQQLSCSGKWGVSGLRTRKAEGGDIG